MRKDKYYIDRKFYTIFRDGLYLTKAAYDALANEDWIQEEHFPEPQS